MGKMYESPITVFQMSSMDVEYGRTVEKAILEAIWKIGVDVDKDELLKALAYDRDQYKKGYEDGLAEGRVSGIEHARWEISWDGCYLYCSNCRTEPENGKMSKYCPECGAIMDKED